MLVIEASVVVDYLLDQLAPEAVAVLVDEDDLRAPELLDYEIASALRGIALGGELDDAGVERIIAQYSELSIERHSFGGSLAALHELRHNFTSYDAAYVVLAKALGAPLVTADAKMIEAAKIGVEVQLYA